MLNVDKGDFFIRTSLDKQVNWREMWNAQIANLTIQNMKNTA